MQSPFEGRLVRLRAREPTDAEFFHRALNDPEVTQYISVRYPVSMEFERRYVQDAPAPSWSAAAFTIETLDGRLTGSCALRGQAPENRMGTLGIWIGDKAYWNGGYGTDAMLVLCRFGFEHMNLNRIELHVFEDNPRAIRVYEKVGFRREGCLRDADYRYGRYRGIVVMGLLRKEWEEAQLSPVAGSSASPEDGE